VPPRAGLASLASARAPLLLLAAVLCVAGFGYFLPSRDAGAITVTFTGPSVLVDDTDSPARAPRVAVGNDAVIHVVWVDPRDGTDGISYARSTDRGQSWSASVRVDDAAAGVDSAEPDLAVDVSGTRVFVVYRDDRRGSRDIFAAASDDGGRTWGASVRIDDDAGFAQAQRPRVAVDADGVVYVVWEDKRNPSSSDQVYFARSTTSGASWSPNVQISTAGAQQHAFQPSVTAAEPGRVLVLWRQVDVVFNTVTRVVSGRSSNGGTSWAYSDIAWGAPGESYVSPDVSLTAGGRAFAVWTSEQAGAARVVSSTSPNAGQLWIAPVRVDDAPAASGSLPRMPSVSAVAGRPFVVWEDSRNGDADIFASGSEDDGATWGDCPVPCAPNNDARVDDSGASGTAQGGPDAAGTAWDLSMVWQDQRRGGSDIYFALYNGVSAYALRVTEFQDSPDSDEAVEIAHTGWVDADVSGFQLVVDGTPYDLSPLGVLRPGEHRVVGNTMGADLTPPGFRLDDNGGTLQIRGPQGVADVVRYGQQGAVPDPLPSVGSARYFDGGSYTSEWAMDPTPTLGTRNDGAGVDAAPLLVLNEAFFNALPGREAEQFVEVAYVGSASLDVSGFRVVGGTEVPLAGLTLSPADPYALVTYNQAPAFFDALRVSGDNLYLYAPDAALWDMVGWNSLHPEGTSVCRVPSANGTHQGFDDATSTSAGWQFGCAPSRPTVTILPSQTGRGALGETVPFNLTIKNRETFGVLVDLDWSVPPPGWSVAAFAPDGVTLVDDSDGDSLPDVVLDARGTTDESVAVVIRVGLPAAPPPEDSVVTRVDALASAGGSDAAYVTTLVAPSLVVDRTATPDTIDLRGSGGQEETTITLSLQGAGVAIPGREAGAADVVFVIDDTGSMGSWINQAKADVDAITDRLLAETTSVRFGLVSYGDEASDEIDIDLDLTADVARFKSALNALVASGGGDWPEDADIALEMAANLTWRQGETAKIMVLIGDAPTHDDAHLVEVARWAYTVRGIHTNAIACGDNAVMLSAFNRTALAGAGYFTQLGTPDFMADAILSGILALVTPLDQAARDADLSDPDPMVRDVLPPHIAYVPGTFIDPVTGAPRNPEFVAVDGSGNTILEWNLSVLKVGDAWSVAFRVTSGRAGEVPTSVFPQSRASYLNWRGEHREMPFPDVHVTVRGPGPLTILDVGYPKVSSAVLYVTTRTPFRLIAIDRGGAGIAMTLYRVGGNPWTDYASTGPFGMGREGEHVLEWFSADHLGVVEPTQSIIVRADDTPPATTMTVGSPNHVAGDTYITSATALGLASADGGETPVGVDLTRYRVGAGPWIDYIAPFTLSGDGFHSVDVQSLDRLGNVEMPATTELVVDDTPPTTAISPAVGPFMTWTEFALSALDTGCGVARSEYRIDGGAWLIYGAPFALSAGSHRIGYRSEDHLGNRESERDLEVQVGFSLPPETTLKIGDPRWDATLTYVTSATPLSLSAVDRSTLGIRTRMYRADGGPWVDYDETAPFRLAGEKPHLLEWYSEDFAGGIEAVRSRTLVVDDTPPTTTPSRVDGRYPRGVTFAFTAADAGSGVARTEIRLDGGGWTTYASPLQLAVGGHTIGFRSVDNLNNTEAERTVSAEIEGEPPPPVRESNWKPVVAAGFAFALAAVGAWSSQRAPSPAGARPRVRAFAVTALPFVVAEAGTGVLSFFTGLFAIPPILGLGTAVDLGILVAGVALSAYRVLKRTPRM